MTRTHHARLSLLVPLFAGLIGLPKVPLAAQGGWEVTGELAGPAPGWHGAIVAVPALRVGTLAGGLGRFTLRARAAGGCYEAVIRTQGRHLTHLRFLAPDSGRRDLGRIVIRELTDWPDRNLGDPPPPEVHDTLGTCTPEVSGGSLRWPAAHAIVQGRLLRGERPLAGVPIDLSCGYYHRPRATTDTTGGFRFESVLEFPDDQVLADGYQASCRLTIAAVAFDPPLPILVTFAPFTSAAPITQADWRLPAPTFQNGRIIGLSELSNEPIVLNGTVSVSAGLPNAQQMVSLEIVPRPVDIVGCEGMRCTLLPHAIRTGTGWKLPGQVTLRIALPDEYARRVGAGERLVAFTRLPADQRRADRQLRQLEVQYDRRLQIVQVTALSNDFDDIGTPEGTFHATIVLGFMSR